MVTSGGVEGRVNVKVLATQSYLTLGNPLHCKTPLSMESSRQEYWSGLLFPSPGDLPDPEIKPRSPAFQADSLTYESPGKNMEGYEGRLSIFILYMVCTFKKKSMHSYFNWSTFKILITHREFFKNQSHIDDSDILWFSRSSYCLC